MAEQYYPSQFKENKQNKPYKVLIGSSSILNTILIKSIKKSYFSTLKIFSTMGFPQTCQQSIQWLTDAVKERIYKDGLWMIFSFHVSILLAVASYTSDVGSDYLLAGRYFKEGDIGWATFTTAFILLPWMIQLMAALLISRSARKSVKKVGRSTTSKGGYCSNLESNLESKNKIVKVLMKIRVESILFCFIVSQFHSSIARPRNCCDGRQYPCSFG